MTRSRLACLARVAARTPRTVAAAVTLFGAAAAPAAEVFPYQFTPIASTSSGFFSQMGVFPAINDTGRVAFRGTLVTGSNHGLFTRGTSGGIHTITEASLEGFSIIGIAPDITASGKVFFMGQRDNPPTDEFGIFKSNGSPPTTVVDWNGQFDVFYGFQVNDSEVVAFGADLDSGPQVIATRSPSATSILARSGGAEFSSLSRFPAINDNGMVAFAATRTTGVRGIYATIDGTTFWTVVDDSGPFSAFENVSINSSEAVAFRGVREGTGFGVFLKSGGTTTTIAPSGGPLLLERGGIALNASGKVVYEAQFADDGSGIFDGPHPVFNRVLASADVIFGKIVIGVMLSREGLSDTGQITFDLNLFDPQTMTLDHMTVRADPLALPVDTATLGQQLQFTTGTDMTVGVTQDVLQPGAAANLEFDVTFLTAPGGELTIGVDGVVLESIPATVTGQPMRVRVPVDVTRIHPRNPPQSLQLQLSLRGSRGLTARIDDVTFPGLVNGDFERGWLSGWTVSKGAGLAGVAHTGDPPLEAVR